jgi:hypothetical protein
MPSVKAAYSALTVYDRHRIYNPHLLAPSVQIKFFRQFLKVYNPIIPLNRNIKKQYYNTKTLKQ